MTRFIVIPALLVLGPIALAAHAAATPQSAWNQVQRSRFRWMALLLAPLSAGILVFLFSALAWLLILASDLAAVAYLTNVRPVLSVAYGTERLARGQKVSPTDEWLWPVAAVLVALAGLTALVLL